MSDKDQEKDLEKIAQQTEQDEFVPSAEQPPAIALQPSEASKQLAGYVVTGVSVVFSVLAQKRGAHWQLHDNEIADLHNAVARVAQQYIKIDLNSPLIALASVAAAIALPRVLVELSSKGAQVEQPVEAVQGGD